MDIKHVTQVHQTNYHYSQDSIITVLVPIDPLPTDSIISQLPNDSIVWYKNSFPSPLTQPAYTFQELH